MEHCLFAYEQRGTVRVLEVPQRNVRIHTSGPAGWEIARTERRESIAEDRRQEAGQVRIHP